MSNRWKAAFAWMASMSVVCAIFVPRGVSPLGLASVSVVGLVVLVMSALWAGYPPARSISQILQDAEAGPLAAPVPARISKDLR